MGKDGILTRRGLLMCGSGGFLKGGNQCKGRCRGRTRVEGRNVGCRSNSRCTYSELQTA